MRVQTVLVAIDIAVATAAVDIAGSEVPQQFEVALGQRGCPVEVRDAGAAWWSRPGAATATLGRPAAAATPAAPTVALPAIVEPIGQRAGHPRGRLDGLIQPGGGATAG